MGFCDTTPLEAAQTYARRNWAVMPVHSVTIAGICSCGALEDYKGVHKHAIGKHPYPEHAHKDASKEASQIEAWWNTWPNANVAIATGARSGLIVLDIDKKSDGLKSLDFIQRRWGKLPHTPMVHSGGGGIHFYFQHPGFEVRGRRGMFPGVDVMADGGRINAPPSNHKLGTIYKWDLSAQPENVEPAILPHWLLRLILHKRN